MKSSILLEINYDGVREGRRGLVTEEGSKFRKIIINK